MRTTILLTLLFISFEYSSCKLVTPRLKNRYRQQPLYSIGRSGSSRHNGQYEELPGIYNQPQTSQTKLGNPDTKTQEQQQKPAPYSKQVNQNQYQYPVIDSADFIRNSNRLVWAAPVLSAGIGGKLYGQNRQDTFGKFDGDEEELEENRHRSNIDASKLKYNSKDIAQLGAHQLTGTAGVARPSGRIHVKVIPPTRKSKTVRDVSSREQRLPNLNKERLNWIEGDGYAHKRRASSSVDDGNVLLFQTAELNDGNNRKSVQIPLALARSQGFSAEGYEGSRERSNFGDVWFVAIVAGCSAAAIVGVIGAGYCFYKFQQNNKAAADVDYPAYGVVGPANKENPGSGNVSPSGDRKLAQSAQMYHYHHQKQQMIASEKAVTTRHTSASDVDSDEENEEGEYTVYECPGLAPTGEMEVKNPLFQDDITPVSSPPVNSNAKDKEK